MGRAQSIRLAAEGAKVAIVDFNATNGAAVANEIQKLGGIANYYYADLTEPNSIEEALQKIRDDFGSADLLFNNAGTVLVKAYVDTSESEFDHIMNTNVRSAFMVTKRVIPEMISKGGGAIVMMSSVSAIRGCPLEAIYGASKAAVQALMMNITAEYRKDGIRCNAVCPAFVRTPHGLKELEDFKRTGIEIGEADMARTQLKICEPEEVSGVALFLASEDARFLNGVAINIDNGWMVMT